MQRLLKNTTMLYRDPTCYISDLENLTGKSYRTAQRIMGRIRSYYRLSKFERPTIEQVKAYLIACSNQENG